MNKWIGFCQYRKFWTLEKNKKEYNTIDELNKSLLKKFHYNMKTMRVF